jgi:hypothetical protein
VRAFQPSAFDGTDTNPTRLDFGLATRAAVSVKRKGAAMLQTFRSSVLPCRVISVEVPGVIDWARLKTTNLQCAYREDNKIRLRHFIGTSLRHSLQFAQGVFGFDEVSLVSTSGQVINRYFPNRKIIDAATDDAISFRAVLANGVLTIQCLESAAEQEQEFERILVLDVEGRREVYSGPDLPRIFGEIKRFHVYEHVNLIHAKGWKRRRSETEWRLRHREPEYRE